MIWLLTTAHAATWSVPGDATSLAEAVAIAASGDTIELAGGTWTECLDTGGKDLAIVGAGADATVIDASGLCDSAIVVDEGETLALTDLAVVNWGGRGLYASGSSLVLEEVDLRDSGGSDIAGAGAWITSASLTLLGGAITDNQGSSGGGLYLDAYASVEVEGTTFSGNQAANGGAILAYHDNALSIRDAVFSSNSATAGSGGALNVQWYTALDIQGSELSGNNATAGGGAIELYVPEDPVIIQDSVLADNSAGGGGGAIAAEWYHSLHLDGVELSGNYAAGSGGGVYHYPGAYHGQEWDLQLDGSALADNQAGVNGGGVYFAWGMDVQVRDSTWDRNSAAGTGGALLVYVADQVDLVRNRFCDNDAVNGGGLSIQWATGEAWANNLFLRNSAAYGGAAHRYASYGGSLEHNSFVGNSASEWGGAYYASWAYGPLQHDIVAFTPEGAGIYAGDAHSYAQSPVSFSGFADNEVVDAAGYFWVTDGEDGNIVVDDPGFVAWDAALPCDALDLRLAMGSPFRDAGDPEADPDLDGSVADLGAYGGPLAPVEDHDGDGFDTTTDCVDSEAGIHPLAEELCDGWDQDCDGEVDEDAVDAGTWYLDGDGDGYGGEAVSGCEQPEGTVDLGGDCDDVDPDAWPGADEVPDDGIDQDCDGQDEVTPAADTGDTGGADGGAADGGEDGGRTVVEQAGEEGGCGCAAGGSVGGLWLMAGLVALGRRRPAGSSVLGPLGPRPTQSSAHSVLRPLSPPPTGARPRRAAHP